MQSSVFACSVENSKNKGKFQLRIFRTASVFKSYGRGFNPPLGKTWIFIFYFLCFFGQKLVYSMLWCIKKDINTVYFIFWKCITIAHLVLVQKWNFPFLSWTSLKWITKNTCWTVVKRPLQNCPWMFRSIFLRP